MLTASVWNPATKAWEQATNGLGGTPVSATREVMTTTDSGPSSGTKSDHVSTYSGHTDSGGFSVHVLVEGGRTYAFGVHVDSRYRSSFLPGTPSTPPPVAARHGHVLYVDGRRHTPGSGSSRPPSRSASRAGRDDDRRISPNSRSSLRHVARARLCCASWGWQKEPSDEDPDVRGVRRRRLVLSLSPFVGVPDGVVEHLARRSPPYVVRWLVTDHEATVYPGSDAVVVTAAEHAGGSGRQRGRAACVRSRGSG